MGTILQFRQDDTSKRHRADTRSGMGSPDRIYAEIIIFPGVRIERQTDPDRPAAKRVTGKRTRNTARRKI